MTHQQRIWFTLCSSIFALFSLLLYQWAPSSESHYDLDSYGYTAIAQHFATTAHLAHPNSNEMPVQTVGYPFFIGILYTLFGNGSLAVVLAQLCLSIISGFLILKTALLLFGSIAGFFSALLWSCNLGFLIFTQFIMTEVLLATLILACVYNFFVYMKKNSQKNLIYAALWAGFSVAIKPVALLYSIGLCLCIILWLPGNYIKKLKSVMLFCSIFSLPVLGYMAFNKITHNQFVVSSLVNENLYVYFLSKLIVHTEGSSYTTAMQKIVTTTQDFPRTDFRRWQTARQQFWHIVSTNPLLVIKIWCGNVVKTFLGLFSTQLKLFTGQTLKGGDFSFSNTKGSLFERCKNYIFDNTTSPLVQTIALLEALWNIFRYIIVACALFFLLRSKNYFLFCFFIGSIAYFSIITGHDGCGRYRMMFEPLLIILVSYALSLLYSSTRTTSTSYTLSQSIPHEAYVCKKTIY